LSIYIIPKNKVGIALSLIYYYSAPEGKYLEPVTSSHPMEAEGYEIHPGFVFLVRELDFTGGLDENPYKHLQDFEELCATLLILGLNHETIKWKTIPFSLTGWAKKWYKLHVYNCHGSWSVLKDEFCFAFFPLSRIIDLHNEVLSFAQKEGESIGAAWSQYKQHATSGQELSIPEAKFMQHFVHGLSTKYAGYLDVTSRGVFVQCTVE
jgi:hypothetical protein